MNTLRERLLREHEELGAVLRCLAEDAEAPQVGQLAATWATFERRLLAHMTAEEELLLPMLRDSHPAEVEQTRTEHALIRRRLAELGVQVELHAVRKAEILALVHLLEAHAQHEDSGLYEHAGQRATVALEHRARP